MIITLDEEQSNSDKNRKSSATDLEELFQQLLVLEKTPKPSPLQSNNMTNTMQQFSQSPKIKTPLPKKTMYNLRNMAVLPISNNLNNDKSLLSHHSSERETVLIRLNKNNYNCNEDIFCSSKNDLKSKFNGRRFLKVGNNNSLPIRNIVIIAILILLLNLRLTFQEELCPKTCTCSETETTCMESYAASGPLHTLHFNTIKLTLNNNNLTQFTGLDYLAKLEHINLAYNKISSIDFGPIKKSVKFLNTSHNNINELKDTLVNNALLEINDTKSQNYNSNSDSQTSNSKLLKKLDKINIEDLILNHNHLSTIRSYTFIRWHKLQKLDLSYNSLTLLDAHSFMGLINLESLNLRGNKFLQVPSSALFGITLPISYSITNTERIVNTKPSSLKYLDLGENLFKHIESDSFSTLEKAQELYLDMCLIESIDEQAFKGLHTLHLLSLDKNQLKEVPTKSFKYLSLLRSLKMNSNKFNELPIDSFNSLVNLEELELNYGYFNQLQNGVFSGLDLLKKLEITHNNNLTHIEQGTMENLKNLIYINLFSNNLTGLPDDLNDQFETILSSHQLQVLDLRDNQLICNCDLKWLTKWLKKFNETVHKDQILLSKVSISSLITNSPPTTIHPQYILKSTTIIDTKYVNELINLTCAGPAALKKKLIIDLPDNKLECLKPESKLNVRIGFALLFIMLSIMTLVCLFNFCRNKKRLFFLLKENLVQNNINIVLPYSQNLHKNVDDLKKETQLYESGLYYEDIDYSNCQGQQIYTLTKDSNNEQVYYNGSQPQQNHQQQPINTRYQ